MAGAVADVRTIFGAIATRYDLANHVLSCGIDFYWRRRAADIVAGWQPRKVIDLATGTGDLALALQRKLPAAEIVGIDFLPEMVEMARKKGVRRTKLANAMELPFEDASFDCATVAFGLRNMENWSGALKEMARVLKSGGRLMVLEFSLPEKRLLCAIYRVYLHRCVPWLGSVLTGRRNAYAYLGDSIECFPNGRAMCELMVGNGFVNAAAQPLTGGIVSIYTAARR
jgi:demethylmenaquinone methyltransferase/2-methoxy-6-polyprenyl-1,4-benzoquinol methylase